MRPSPRTDPDELRTDELSTGEQETDGSVLPAPGRQQTLRRLQVAVVALVLLLTGSLGAIALLVSRSGSPAQTSPEVGFARDMYAHHAQAIAMAMLVRNRVPEPLNTLAEEVVVNQAEQQGIMLTWLSTRDLLAADGTWRSMAWMEQAPDAMADMPGHGQPGATDQATENQATENQATGGTSPAGWAVMPGMASDEHLSELARLRGTGQEVLFLQLMTRHHQAGAAMAEAYLELGDDEQLSALAEGIVTGQEREITLMGDLLAARGATAEL